MFLVLSVLANSFRLEEWIGRTERKSVHSLTKRTSYHTESVREAWMVSAQRDAILYEKSSQNHLESLDETYANAIRALGQVDEPVTPKVGKTLL